MLLRIVLNINVIHLLFRLCNFEIPGLYLCWVLFSYTDTVAYKIHEFLQVRKQGLSVEAVKLQIQQIPLVVLSIIGAVMTGMIAPGFAVLLSEISIVSLLAQCDSYAVKSAQHAKSTAIIHLNSAFVYHVNINN